MGNNASGKLGNGTTTSQTTPVQIGTATNWSGIAAGADFSLAVRSDGTLWAWGANGNGQLGNGTTTSQSSPVQIGADTTWRAVSAGSSFSAASARTAPSGHGGITRAGSSATAPPRTRPRRYG
jgi:alpha-tubulin suppressor-like RCC1 family protein